MPLFTSLYNITTQDNKIITVCVNMKINQFPNLMAWLWYSNTNGYLSQTLSQGESRETFMSKKTRHWQDTRVEKTIRQSYYLAVRMQSDKELTSPKRKWETTLSKNNWLFPHSYRTNTDNISLYTINLPLYSFWTWNDYYIQYKMCHDSILETKHLCDYPKLLGGLKVPNLTRKNIKLDKPKKNKQIQHSMSTWLSVTADLWTSKLNYFFQGKMS